MRVPNQTGAHLHGIQVNAGEEMLITPCDLGVTVW